MSRFLILHGLAVKKHADAAALADFTGLPRAVVDSMLAELKRGGRVAEAQGRYLLAPLARVALEGQYAAECALLRASAAFMAAYESFERINVTLKSLITDWQTIVIGGTRVPNDHADAGYDLRIVGRLGDLHGRVEPVLAALARELPRLAYYERGLTEALERAEAGSREWVSDARIGSYHTLWFELHEDLLRLVGRQRQE